MFGKCLASVWQAFGKRLATVSREFGQDLSLSGLQSLYMLAYLLQIPAYGKWLPVMHVLPDQEKHKQKTPGG